jgi:Flp pilus assembly protein TadG
MTLCCIELFVLAIVAARAAIVKRRQTLAAAAAAAAASASNTTQLTQQNDDDDSTFMTESLLKQPQHDCCVNPPNHNHYCEQCSMTKALISRTPTNSNTNEIVAVGILCEEGNHCEGVDNKVLIPAQVDVE